MLGTPEKTRDSLSSLIVKVLHRLNGQTCESLEIPAKRLSLAICHTHATGPVFTKNQDEVILIFSLFYVTKINRVLLELNGKNSK
jgi:hypothetical protein